MIYWTEREGLEYYRVAMDAVIGESLLDVGAGTQHGCRYLDRLDTPIIHTIELPPDKGIRLPGTSQIFGDFLRWDPEQRYDTVTCLQCLEHVDRPGEFAARLFAVALVRVVISIPYRWERSQSKGHNGLDESTLRAWTGREPVRSPVASRRLVAVYDL